MEIVHAKNQYLIDINKCVNLIHGIVQSSFHIHEFLFKFPAVSWHVANMHCGLPWFAPHLTSAASLKREISMGIRLWFRWPRNQGSAEARDFSHHNVWTSSGAHLASCEMVPAHFAGNKAAAK
jgi:hypothetical protein